MFRKPFKVKSNSQLRSSDRKKLHVEINQQFPQLTEEVLNFILPMKEAMFQLKVLSHSEQLVTIYCLQKVPMIFETQKVIYPTVYMLWNVPDLVYTFTTHPEVTVYLARGADLMLPGVVLPKGKEMDTYGSLRKGDRVAVNLTTNKAAVAVGVAANSSYQMCVKNGKCVEILHFYGDHLSMDINNLQLPELGPVIGNTGSGKLTVGSESPDPGFQYLASVTGKARVNSEKIENFSSCNIGINNIKLPLDETRACAEGKYSPQPDMGDTTTGGTELPKDFSKLNFSMDDILKYCFFKSLKTSIKKEDLPILTCNFYKLHMVPMCPKGESLEIKSTSFKKLSNFLNEMDQLGVIKVETVQKGVQSITKIDFNHDLLNGFLDKFSNIGNICAATSINSTTQLSSAVPQITEKFIITAAVLPLFQEFSYRRRETVTAAEVRKVVEDYVNVNNLTNPANTSEVILDQVLMKAANSKTHNEVLHWNQLILRIFSQMDHSYKVEVGNGVGIKTPEIKGKLQPININVQTRSGNKKVTLVNNLELFGINVAEFSKLCQHGAAASTTINTLPFGKSLQLQIQGNQVAFV